MTWEGDFVASATGSASGAITAWNALVGAVRSEAPGNRLDEARVAVASVLTPSGALVGPAGAVNSLAEQFTADVSAVDDGQRTVALAELGPSALPFVQAVWVCDLGTRARGALDELFGSVVLDDPMADGPGADVSAWDAQERFLREVAKLGSLDPVTSELVRLRGARAHGCRLCQSLRNRTAVQTAGEAELFERTEAFGDGGTTERHLAAVALVDAIIWQPMTWPSGLAERVREWFSPAEAIELVLDLVRNAANKIAVVFGADAPHVTDGVEYYDIDPTSGELVYGLPPVPLQAER
ncbi:MAG TPA: hypothetical protein VFH70_00215 [Acidimicrobiales bacterium]|nr:hypothetical protein [Acidimicrobiales bacterium]